MLGNDVVDLRDPESRPESFRPRFDERVFLIEERRAIERDRDPMARRWAHWAAKEAAFKLAKQTDPDFVFAPGKSRVHFDQPVHEAGQRLERRGIVEWTADGPASALERVEVRSFETEDRIHLIALPAAADWEAVEFAAEPLEDPGEDASAAVRRLAIREIARSLGVARHRLSIGRRGVGSPVRSAASGDAPPAEALPRIYGASRIPTLEIDGVETDVALSLSHHGRWIAYAMTPRTQAAVVRPGSLEKRAGLAQARAAEH
jgi:hypothetical protein